MKKYFLLVAAAATVLAVSCAKEKNQPTTDPTPQIEDNTPQPIRFGTQIAEVKSPITKSAIENTGWDGEQLFIYGLELSGTNVVESNVGTLENPTYEIYINEVPATAPQSNDALDDRQRDPINVYKPGTTDYYYYKGTNVYNFYGYYVGGAKYPDPTAPETLIAAAGKATETIDDNHVVTSIAIEHLEIAGTDDIMIATTDKFEDYLYAQSLPNASVTVSPDKIYSATSARQGVVPDLAFKHLLSRFVFETAYGGAHNGDYNANRAKVKIKSLKLESPYKGTFTVLGANPGFAATDDVKFFELEGLETAVSPGKDYDAGNVDYGEYAPLGSIDQTSAASGTHDRTASILAVPKTGTVDSPAKYKLVLNVSQYDGATPTPNELENQDVELEVDMSKLALPTPVYSSEAGKQYRVKIIVYGLEEIKLTVSLEAWGEVGETIIDPDQDQRTAVAITTGVDNDVQAVTVGTPVDVTGATVTGATWEEVQITSSNTAIATVVKSNTEGQYTITGVKAGPAKIYIYVPATTGNNAHQGALKAVTVNVSAAPTTLSGVPANQNIDNTSGNAKFSITGVKVQAGGVDLDPQPTLTYASNHEEFATVNASGVVTAVGNGTATITISYAGNGTYAACLDTFTVTVGNTPANP